MDGKNVYLKDKDSYNIPCYRGIEMIFAAQHNELPENIGQLVLIGDSQAEIAENVIRSSFGALVSA